MKFNAVKLLSITIKPTRYRTSTLTVKLAFLLMLLVNKLIAFTRLVDLARPSIITILLLEYPMTAVIYLGTALL